jgi:hypothetical protein
MLTEPLLPCSAAPLGKPNGGVLQSDLLPRQCISDGCCCVVLCVVCCVLVQRGQVGTGRTVRNIEKPKTGPSWPGHRVLWLVKVETPC